MTESPHVARTSEQEQTAWYDDGSLVAQCPWPWRCYARYCRRMRRKGHWRVIGGSFVHRWMARLTPAASQYRSWALRVDSIDIYVDLCDERFSWVLGEIRGDCREYQWMRQWLRAGDTFIDIGANHGAFSLVAARLIGDGGRIIASEPNPALAKLVRLSLDANGFAHAGHVENAAVGERHELCDLHIPRIGSSGSASLLAGLNKMPTRSIRVQVVRLDELVQRLQICGPCMMKVDVEGNELAVMRGGRGFISRLHSPIIIELNPTALAEAGASGVQLVNELVSLGYDRFASSLGDGRELSAAEVEVNRQQNLLAYRGALTS